MQVLGALLENDIGHDDFDIHFWFRFCVARRTVKCASVVRVAWCCDSPNVQEYGDSRQVRVASGRVEVLQAVPAANRHCNRKECRALNFVSRVAQNMVWLPCSCWKFAGLGSQFATDELCVILL